MLLLNMHLIFYVNWRKVTKPSANQDLSAKIKASEISFSYCLGFATEPDVVKLQIINLAVKLLLTNPEQTHALAHYIFFMAKFDTNYDIRDKVRLIRFLLPQNPVC